MGGLKAKTRGRILWIWWKSSLFKKDSASCCYNVLWEEGNITAVDNVIRGEAIIWVPAISVPFHMQDHIFVESHTHAHTHTRACARARAHTHTHTNAHSNKQHLCTAHFATKEFQCRMHSFTILNQPPVHDTNSSARFSPYIKSLNSNVSSSLSIITKSVHLNWTELKWTVFGFEPFRARCT